MAAIGWRTVAQRGTERFNSAGRFESGVEVVIETDNGTPNTFFFPQAQYNVKYVEDTINEWAERERAIHSLGNGG